MIHKSILDYIPFGKENAIARADLCKLSGLRDRDMRRAIEAARKHSAVLNSQDGNGYYQPLPEEANCVKGWIN